MLFELGQGLSGIPPAVVRRGNPWRVVRRNTARTTESVHTPAKTHRLGARPDLRRSAILVDVGAGELSEYVIKCFLSEIIGTARIYSGR